MLPSFYYRRTHASIEVNFYCHLGSWGLSPSYHASRTVSLP